METKLQEVLAQGSILAKDGTCFVVETMAGKVVLSGLDASRIAIAILESLHQDERLGDRDYGRLADMVMITK